MSRKRIAGVAFAVWGAQYIAVLWGTHAPTWTEALRSFKRWDSVWYEAIADYGYWKALPFATPYPGAQTVAWFPGYPLAGRMVRSLLGLDTQMAMMLTAALFSLVFWIYAVAILSELRLRWQFKVLAILLIAAHPSAFFMYSEYSESLFIAAVLGFCYWGSRSGRGTALLAAVHGFVSSATRLIGIPLAVLPVLGALAPRDLKGGWRSALNKLAWPLGVSLVSSLGGLAFFAFLQAQFGSWSLYMDTQTHNWGIRPDYWALLSPASYSVCTADILDSGCMSQTSVPLTFGLIAAAALLLGYCVWKKRLRSNLAPFLVDAAVVCFAVSVAGLASRQMISMIRYTFPPYAFAILALCVCGAEIGPGPLTPIQMLFAQSFADSLLLAGAVFLVQGQQTLLFRFVSWGWVA